MILIGISAIAWGAAWGVWKIVAGPHGLFPTLHVAKENRDSV